jgi:translation elongation factor EF-G
MFGYAVDLRSRTHGRGSYVMQFARYQRCDPAENQDTGDSMVGAPRKPIPPRLDSSVALPEPTEDDLRE